MTMDVKARLDRIDARTMQLGAALCKEQLPVRRTVLLTEYALLLDELPGLRERDAEAFDNHDLWGGHPPQFWTFKAHACRARAGAEHARATRSKREPYALTELERVAGPQLDAIADPNTGAERRAKAESDVVRAAYVVAGLV